MSDHQTTTEFVEAELPVAIRESCIRIIH